MDCATITSSQPASTTDRQVLPSSVRVLFFQSGERWLRDAKVYLGVESAQGLIGIGIRSALTMYVRLRLIRKRT
jgi:hypothetical protein